MTSQIFDLSPNSINARWEGKGPIQMQQDAGGVILRTTGTGIFITSTDLHLSPQMGSLTISAETETTLYLTWIYKDDPEQENHSLEINIPSGKSIQTPFSLSDIPSWNARAKKLGLILLPHTTIELHQMQFDQLNILEKSIELVRSFWTFDDYRTYSINFLWGPHLASNPVAREDLFAFVPPPSLSGTYCIFIFLILLFSLIGFLRKYERNDVRKKQVFLAGFWLLLATWILFDVRMGSEFLHYVAEDHADYIAAPESTRTFRDRNRFYDFAAFTAPLVSDRASFIFFAEQQWPYLGNMRYLTYPAIPGIDIQHDDTWVIYRRSDVTITNLSELAIDGQPITGHGEVLGRFDNDSFIFRSDTAAISS